MFQTSSGVGAITNWKAQPAATSAASTLSARAFMDDRVRV